MELDVGHRYLGVSSEHRDPAENSADLSGERVGDNFGGKLQAHTQFVSDQPESKKVSGFGGPLVDGPLEDVF
jgi:hypothetical protein